MSSLWRRARRTRRKIPEKHYAAAVIRSDGVHVGSIPQRAGRVSSFVSGGEEASEAPANLRQCLTAKTAHSQAPPSEEGPDCEHMPEACLIKATSLWITDTEPYSTGLFSLVSSLQLPSLEVKDRAAGTLAGAARRRPSFPGLAWRQVAVCPPAGDQEWAVVFGCQPGIRELVVVGVVVVEVVVEEVEVEEEVVVMEVVVEVVMEVVVEEVVVVVVSELVVVEVVLVLEEVVMKPQNAA
ncbi:unnamed protein product [Gadus morhua 'NCC']